MNSLEYYTKEAQSKLIEEAGAFFAFGSKQVEERRVKDVEYVQPIRNFLVPKENCEAFMKSLDELYLNAKKAYLEKYGKEAIIKYQLSNHECYYTGSIEDVEWLINDYGVTREEILAVYYQELPNQDL